MKNKTLNTIKYGIMAIAIVSAGLQVAVKAQSDAERGLEGVWTTRITPRNCSTGDPIPGAAEKGI